jgi:heme exporter protein CcmD
MIWLAYVIVGLTFGCTIVAMLGEIRRLERELERERER